MRCFSTGGTIPKMWCSGCKQEFEGQADADVQICPHCKNAPKKKRRRVPKLQAASKTPKLRIDNAHPVYKGDEESIEAHELINQAGNWLSVRSMNHVVVFGLFVFLVGQVLHSWAFIVGSFLIWSFANLMSLAGIAIALIAVAATLKNLDRRIKQLSRNIGNARRARSRSGPRKRNKKAEKF